jgi:hypothetical protein
MNKLPIYDIVLKDDDLKQGVGRISLVDEPAIGVQWIKLSEQNTIELDFSITLTDKGLCFGCPPNGDGTTAKGEPDRRCKGDGGKEGAGGKSKSKSSSKVSTVTPNGQIVDTRASEIINSSKKWDERGNTVSVKISKEEMDSIENSIATIKVEHKPYWGDKDQTKGRGPKYYLGEKGADGTQKISAVYISKGKLQTSYDIGYINKDNSTFRLVEHRDSRGFSQSRDAYDLFTNKNSDRALS